MKRFISFTLVFIIIFSSLNIYTFAEPKAIDFYNYSDWAYEELEKAELYGLITQKIRAKMNSNITREEFAEIVANLYAVYFGESADPAPADTFKDTDNAEILKAYNLGIVNGVGNGKFEPNKLATREQIAAMLTRFVMIIAPTADFKPTDASKFKDEKDISPYFLDSVNFMAKWGFIKGSNNRFNPKDNCTKEQAVIITSRIYEYFLLLALGYFDEEETTTENTDTSISTDIVGFWSSEGPSGWLYDSSTGVPVSDYYNGAWYEFYEDGTFKYLLIGSGQIISGIIMWSGKYSIKDNTVTLTNILESWYPALDNNNGVGKYTDKKVADTSLTLRFDGKDKLYITDEGDILDDLFYRVVEE